MRGLLVHEFVIEHHRPPDGRPVPSNRDPIVSVAYDLVILLSL